MRVDVDGNLVNIEAVINDPVLAEVLYEIEDDQVRLDRLANICEIGARVIQRQKDGAQGELLRREVERMEAMFSQTQRDLIDVAGNDFAQSISQVMARLGEHLATISGQLEGALAVADREKDLAVERERGTAKGRTFEEEIVDKLADLARARGDSAQASGDFGGVGGRAGDAVVEIGGAEGPSKGTLVFEAKTGRLSKPEALRELDRAIQTRGADFGILVVRGLSKLPPGTFGLHEYGGNKSILAVGDEYGDGWLECAYSLARARVLQRRTETEGADVDSARAALERALQSLEQVRQIKLKLTAIKGASDETRNLVDAMVEDVKIMLAQATESLTT